MPKWQTIRAVLRLFFLLIEAAAGLMTVVRMLAPIAGREINWNVVIFFLLFATYAHMQGRDLRETANSSRAP